jgi:hypothetical protein
MMLILKMYVLLDNDNVFQDYIQIVKEHKGVLVQPTQDIPIPR